MYLGSKFLHYQESTVARSPLIKFMREIHMDFEGGPGSTPPPPSWRDLIERHPFRQKLWIIHVRLKVLRTGSIEKYFDGWKSHFKKFVASHFERSLFLRSDAKLNLFHVRVNIKNSKAMPWIHK